MRVVLLNLLTLMLCASGKAEELLREADMIVDDFYYLEDVLSVNEPRLSKMISESLISLLVSPMLLPLLQSRPNNVRFLCVCAQIKPIWVIIFADFSHIPLKTCFKHSELFKSSKFDRKKKKKLNTRCAHNLISR